jgi:hypothetical protein
VIVIDTKEPAKQQRNTEQEFKERIFDCTDDPPVQELKFTNNSAAVMISSEQHPSIKPKQTPKPVVESAVSREIEGDQ